MNDETKIEQITSTFELRIQNIESIQEGVDSLKRYTIIPIKPFFYPKEELLIEIFSDITQKINVWIHIDKEIKKRRDLKSIDIYIKEFKDLLSCVKEILLLEIEVMGAIEEFCLIHGVEYRLSFGRNFKVDDPEYSSSSISVFLKKRENECIVVEFTLFSINIHIIEDVKFAWMTPPNISFKYPKEAIEYLKDKIIK